MFSTVCRGRNKVSLNYKNDTDTNVLGYVKHLLERLYL